MKSRRTCLEAVRAGSNTNAALWIDKYLTEQTEKGGNATDGEQQAKSVLIGELTKVKVPAGYSDALKRRERVFAETPNTFAGTAKAIGRVVIGLGESTPLEVGLHLEHTWGVPVLPGSALKGLAAATAHKLMEDDAWRRPTEDAPEGGDSFTALFGTTDEAGEVSFHDAWWVPGEGETTLPILRDVMTVHHPHYYQAQGADVPPPSDQDSPNPIAFASVTGSYRVVVEGPALWCDAALDLLKIGLKDFGIGAKTSSGYGRMVLEAESASQQVERRKAEAEAMRREAEEKARLARERDEARRRDVERLAVLEALDVVSRWRKLIAEADADKAHEWLMEALDADEDASAEDARVDAIASLDAAGRRVLLGLLSHDATNPHLGTWKSDKQRARVDQARTRGATLDELGIATEAVAPAAHADLIAELEGSEDCKLAGLTESLVSMLTGEESWPSQLSGYAVPDDLEPARVKACLAFFDTVVGVVTADDQLSKKGRKAVDKARGRLERHG